MKIITKDQIENLRWMLRKKGAENGYSFNAFEITPEGAYISQTKKAWTDCGDYPFRGLGKKGDSEVAGGVEV